MWAGWVAAHKSISLSIGKVALCFYIQARGAALLGHTTDIEPWKLASQSFSESVTAAASSFTISFEWKRSWIPYLSKPDEGAIFLDWSIIKIALKKCLFILFNSQRIKNPSRWGLNCHSERSKLFIVRWKIWQTFCGYEPVKYSGPEERSTALGVSQRRAV